MVVVASTRSKRRDENAPFSKEVIEIQIVALNERVE